MQDLRGLEDRERGHAAQRIEKWEPMIAGYVVVAVLVAITLLRFWNDVPELEIRRWGIDQEWQVGWFLEARVKPGEPVLTDAPVAIYRSGKSLAHLLRNQSRF